jgi:hypothetical protein
MTEKIIRERTLVIGDIVDDIELLMRTRIHKETVDEYTNAMRQGTRQSRSSTSMASSILPMASIASGLAANAARRRSRRV